MIPENALKDLLSKQEYSRAEKLFFCLAVHDCTPKSTSEIKVLAKKNGLRVADNWNISTILGRKVGFAIRTESGWELTTDGKNLVSDLAGHLSSSPVTIVASGLRSHLAHLSDDQTKHFVEEAIACFEMKRLRAAVVLSWVGAVSLLYEYVIKNKLSEFNTEAVRRFPKWKVAKDYDGLAHMKESNFLEILEGISLIGKSTKQELEGCLRFRNGCGHPNSLKIGEHRAAGHIEALILNVFSKFSLSSA